MKKLFLRVGFVFVVLIALQFSINTNTQAANYSYIGTVGGVDAYWAVTKPRYSDGYEVLYKFVNRNAYRVTIDFTAVFDCGTKDGRRFGMAANTTQAGETNGLYLWDACGDGVSPKTIDLRLKVEK